MAKDKKEEKLIKDYFNTPWFNWFFKWESIDMGLTNLFDSDNDRPHARITWILWKSKRTGRITKKTYNYQIN